jgi:hypothetical protein
VKNKHIKKFGEYSEQDMINLFSEKGWNFIDKKVDFKDAHNNKKIAGKSGVIKSVKNEIATIDIEGEEYKLPFEDFYKNKDAKIHRT